MFWKWLPWQFIVRRVARKQGFIDPIALISRMNRFAEPSEVVMPVEVLRLTAVLQARGFLNSAAIQHNLDWVWPYWVQRQFDPGDSSFIPRAFSLTHINLSHRNWTAVGIPGCEEMPIVDPRGLVTPFYDSWSVDAWIVGRGEENRLIPSQSEHAEQVFGMQDNVSVITTTHNQNQHLTTHAEVIQDGELPVCRITATGRMTEAENRSGDNSLVISLRPYNPDGVSFINTIERLRDRHGWTVNGRRDVHLDTEPKRYAFSQYHDGDVLFKLLENDQRQGCQCPVGLATAAAVFPLEGRIDTQIVIDIPLKKNGHIRQTAKTTKSAGRQWRDNLTGRCELRVPDAQCQFLYEAAVRSLILHSPRDIFPGPFTYKHFWFRDAAYIVNALLSINLWDRARASLQRFFPRQKMGGYFSSQDGEWDSNGQVLWTVDQYCALTNRRPDGDWRHPLERAAAWIKNKRVAAGQDSPHAGLLPPGFSAEHFGPNNYYYWDDFWSVAGLRSAARLFLRYGEDSLVSEFEREAEDLLQAIDSSLLSVAEGIGRPAMPISPYRRLDSAAVGTLSAGYPSPVYSPDDPRLLDTAAYLLESCFVKGGFFHDMGHSGINPYLTLHVAQVLLRAGDERYWMLMKGIADLASSTGQWPEAVHPQTGGGCMGDGQHIWAAAEWVLMVRNCFLREEGDALILCSGIPREWLRPGETLSFGPAPTRFGTVTMHIKCHDEGVSVHWDSRWHAQPPRVRVRFPGHPGLDVSPGGGEGRIAAEGGHVKILMMTNTYKPIVGGLENSIDRFSREYLRRGHTVKIVTPQLRDGYRRKDNVLHVKPLQNFDGKRYFFQVPEPGRLSRFLKRFTPDIIHSHHPYLIGDTALRLKETCGVPLVFTFHTVYNEHTYFEGIGRSRAMAEFMMSLVKGYSDLCDCVFVPSRSMADLLKEKGVGVPMEVIPTGIDVDAFRGGERRGGPLRQLTKDKFLIGFVGRIAEEKNVRFLSRCATAFLQKHPRAHFLMAGDGEAKEAVEKIFSDQGVRGRLHTTGILRGKELADAYRAMDVFIFASHSETQGLVLAEAMASGTPVVAVDAPGVRDLVEDGKNGLMVPNDDQDEFMKAMERIYRLPDEAYAAMRSRAAVSARDFSLEACAEKALGVYERLCRSGARGTRAAGSMWERTRRMTGVQWKLMRNFLEASKVLLTDGIQERHERQ